MTNNSDLDPWFNMIPQSTIQKLIDPAAENLGRGFGGITSIIANPFIKLGIVSETNIQAFETRVKNKNNQIPFDNRDNGKQGLALKTLEDSIYQLDSEILQEYFSNLIASTLDNRKNGSVKPSYSSILKDFSPEDANLFNFIYQEKTLALTAIKLENNKSKEGVVIQKNIILHESGEVNKPSSLDILNRFGLIQIASERNLISDRYVELYNKFEKSELVQKYKESLPMDGGEITIDSVRVLRGNITLTSLGKEFGSVIISD